MGTNHLVQIAPISRDPRAAMPLNILWTQSIFQLLPKVAQTQECDEPCGSESWRSVRKLRSFWLLWKKAEAHVVAYVDLPLCFAEFFKCSLQVAKP